MTPPVGRPTIAAPDEAIARFLHEARSSGGAMGLVHRDLKPDNVLIDHCP